MAERVALVTGGGRGIGKGIALGLAADGLDVAVTYRKDRQAAAETVAEIESMGRPASPFRATSSIPEDNSRNVAEVIDRFGASRSWSTTAASPAGAERSSTPTPKSCNG